MNTPEFGSTEKILVFQQKRQIEEVDAEIDTRVYGLYGLTEEEIRVVEGG